MKREIKLRALTLENELIYFDLHDSELSGDSDVFYTDCISCKVGSEQLFTGLKDKNVKEIFESDVLKHGDALYTVVWKDGAYHLEYPENKQSSNQFTQDRARNFEIIGNIYENPELLKP